MATIFRGLNFHGEKFWWVRVAHKNLTTTNNFALLTLPHKAKGHVKNTKLYIMSSTRRRSLCVGTGRRHFQSAIVEMQHVDNVIYLWLINFSLVQIFVGIIFVSVARLRKLVPHKNFCVYGKGLYASSRDQHTCK